ncbi:MAG: ion channel [Myxococcota bacterium]
MKPRVPSGRPTQLRVVERIARPNSTWSDLYARLLETSWGGLLLGLFSIYLFGNLAFATLYWVDPGGIEHARAGHFGDAFFFSVQTMATIGYGAMSPISAWSNALVTCEAFIGLMGFALATGLVFAKLSRPRANLLFAKHAVITNWDGVPHLMIRAANARTTEIADAHAHASALTTHVSQEGSRTRRWERLPLVVADNPLLWLSWQLMHRIDEGSPLHGWDPSSDPSMVILVSVSGVDAVYADSVQAQQVYRPADVVLGARFADMMNERADGVLEMDYRQLDRLVPDTDDAHQS